MEEKQYKYRVEFNKPTTGGEIGFSVRAAGDDEVETYQKALGMAEKAKEDSKKLKGGNE